VGNPWDAAYADVPPWDIGRPQDAFAVLADAGRLTGRLLDVGCGTGEHTLLAATHGADALGVDVSPRAIELARAKAARRGIAARFAVGDALALPRLGETFDTAIDSGTFHLFAGAARSAYVHSLHTVLEPGGRLYMLAARDGGPGGWGPPGLSRAELVEAFADGWRLEALEHSRYDVTAAAPVDHVAAWLASLVRA
jgi:SAM-dependent methyltransferase